LFNQLLVGLRGAQEIVRGDAAFIRALASFQANTRSAESTPEAGEIKNVKLKMQNERKHPAGYHPMRPF